MKAKKIIAALAALSLTAALHFSCLYPMSVRAEGDSSISTETDLAADPVISRNVPAYTGKAANPGYGNDEHYFTLWNADAPEYLAYDLSKVPESRRKTVIAVWYNLSSYDRLGQYVSKRAEPLDYTIELNAAEGDSYPESGWITAESVTDNPYSSRQHIINMEGYNWIRLNISKAEGDKIELNFDVHDVSDGVLDSWMFYGDSITAGGMVNAYGTSFAKYINQIDPSCFPVQENGGIGGIRSIEGRENIDTWLSVCKARYVSLAYGTNDAWGNPNGAAAYYDNTKYMIDAVIAAGKIPVLPKIPSSTNKDVGPNVGYYNEMVEKLYREYGDKLVKGPDFELFFRENPQYLSDDGVHPDSEGYEAMRKLWAETMYENVYKKVALPAVRGDVNNDGSFSLADAALLQKWILAFQGTALENWQAGDMNSDNKLNVVDLAVMKSQLLEVPTV